MAGRGTDIKLTEEARDAGGLHVILTEYHESPRIDRQLFGRAARQGDPGSFEVLVSLDDELMTRFVPKRLRRFLRRLGTENALGGAWTRPLRRFAQWLAESLNATARRATVEADRKLGKALSFSGQGE